VKLSGMAGRYSGSYLDRSHGRRAVAILAEIGPASLVGRILRHNWGLCWRSDNWLLAHEDLSGTLLINVKTERRPRFIIG
jgi:hypothetical protein